MPEHYDYDAIIIGAGIGGLTAGNILAKNGFKTLILEKNQVPGGSVSTFYKDGYPVDITHSLCGLGKNAFIGKVFKYLGIYDKLKFIELEKAFIYFSGETKKPFICYADLNRYKKDLVSAYPNEKKNITAFFETITHIWDKEILKSYYAPSLLRLLTYPFLFPSLFKYRNYTFERFLSKFTKNDSLKEKLSASWPFLGLDRFSVSALYAICTIMAYHKEKSYFVSGGFGQVPRALADNFKHLGGEILYGIRAEKILLNGSTAFGIKNDNNNEYYARKIVSNIDTKKTFLDLVGVKSLSQKFINKIKKISMSYSAIQINLVVESKAGCELLSSGSIHLQLDKTIKEVLKFNYPGTESGVILNINKLEDFIKTEEKNLYVLNILYLPAGYRIWQKIMDRFGPKTYENLKEEIVKLTIEQLKNIISIESVKFSNVFTPLSFEKWLNASQGAIYDSSCSPDQVLLNRQKFNTPIKNLHMVGAKTFPGHGVAGAICSAVSLSDRLLKGKLTHGRFILD